eukprot:510687_1
MAASGKKNTESEHRVIRSTYSTVFRAACIRRARLAARRAERRASTPNPSASTQNPSVSTRNPSAATRNPTAAKPLASPKISEYAHSARTVRGWFRVMGNGKSVPVENSDAV